MGGIRSFFEKVTDVWHAIDPIAAKSTDYLVSKTMSHNERIAGDLGLGKLQQMAHYYEANPRAAESQAAPIVLAALATAFSGGSASPTLASELEAAQAADTAAGLMTTEDLAAINSGTGLAGDAAASTQLPIGDPSMGPQLPTGDPSMGPQLPTGDPNMGPNMPEDYNTNIDMTNQGPQLPNSGSTDWLSTAFKYGTPIVNALLQKNASDKANSLQQEAVAAALKQQKDQYDTTRADTAPWRAAGTAALDKLMGLMNSGELTSKFSGMNPMEEKGYAFAAKEGQRAIDARARGAGGDVLRSSTQFAEDNANKFYGDAFNRFQTEKTNSNNPLFQIAGFGPQANQQAITAGQNAADNSSSINLYGGAAAGQNALRTGNIYSNGINQLAGASMSGGSGNNNQLAQLISQLLTKGG